MIDPGFSKKFDVFSDLNDTDIKRLFRNSRERKFKKGDFIVDEGELAESMFILLKGEIEIIKPFCLASPGQESSSNDRVLIRMKDDQYVIFGEVGLLRQDKRTAGVRAVKDCVAGAYTQGVHQLCRGVSAARL